MQTSLTEPIKNTTAGQEADRILRACVHCGFCNATCPTYQLLGDELDGPRGRIYLIKSLLEGQTPGQSTRIHLDRCLTCRACETTCPSGVQYGRLLDIGRQQVEQQVRRSLWERFQRFCLRKFLPHSNRVSALLRIARLIRPLLPAVLRRMVPPQANEKPWPQSQHPRKMLILTGCVQPSLAPNINVATARVLDRLGITLVPADGCCGAISHHLSATEEALGFVRLNIDAWWPAIESGAEAIVSTASGCGATVKDYGHLLRDDPEYADKAARVSALARDISEVLMKENVTGLQQPATRRIAFHSPCSLQHGQKLGGVTESLLRKLGFQLTYVHNAHLCCGSAGTYSLLQRALSRRLLGDKVKALEADRPDLIATVNIGCLHFLREEAHVPVRHWIELLDEAEE
jgi:glycolate oxidase iron-sulfur subunit